MPRSFDMATEYAAGAERVRAAFTDRGYWQARLAASGADEATLTALDAGDDGVLTVATTQTVRAERLPAVVGQFHRGDLIFVRREVWTPVRDDRTGARACVTASIDGAPATLTGKAVLCPHGDGARLSLHATVTVRIPLVGGKIETLIGARLADLLNAEQRFTSTWLGEHH